MIFEGFSGHISYSDYTSKNNTFFQALWLLSRPKISAKPWLLGFETRSQPGYRPNPSFLFHLKYVLQYSWKGLKIGRIILRTNFIYGTKIVWFPFHTSTNFVIYNVISRVPKCAYSITDRGH